MQIDAQKAVLHLQAQIFLNTVHTEASGGAVGWGTTPQYGMSRVLGRFQVTYTFCPHSASLRSTQPLTEMSTKEFPLAYSAAGARSCQLYSPSCVKRHSKEQSPTFHPSKSSRPVTGKLQLWPPTLVSWSAHTCCRVFVGVHSFLSSLFKPLAPELLLF